MTPPMTEPRPLQRCSGCGKWIPPGDKLDTLRCDDCRLRPPTFGDPTAIAAKKRKKYRGPILAELRGPGPMAERCGTCRYLQRKPFHNKVYFKCQLYRDSNCDASDIRKKDPACARWEPIAL